MSLVEYTSIIVPENRQRREFSPIKLLELEESISSKGLMHPPVVRSDGVTLVAGERRLRTLISMHEAGKPILYLGELLPIGMIPVTKLFTLSDYEYAEAELEENVLRVDLTWQEKAFAIEALHQHRVFGNEKQTITDTATEILGRKPHGGEASQLVRNSILLANSMDDPDVAKAKTEKEAFKIVEKKAKAEHRKRLSAEFKTAESKHTIIKGDSLEILSASTMTSYFDVIVTDPPYGMGADNFGSMASNTHEYEDSPDWFSQNVDRMANLFYACTKENAHAYVFCDIDNFPLLRASMKAVGWKVWRTPLIWYKGNMGMLPHPDFGPRRTYEICLFATKGTKPVQLIGAHDVIQVEKDSSQVHAAQKPIALYEELLRRSSLPGERVLDAFCGSAPIFPAATKLELIATGIELGDSAYDMAVERLALLGGEE